MRSLPTLAHCPDRECAVPIGAKHNPRCEVAICLLNGQQRLLHLTDSVLPHLCGQDTWSGRVHGTDQCHEYGWFVRRATAADSPLTGWIPCPSGHPDAVPDLDRLARHATWSVTGQRWIRTPAVAGRG